MKKFVVLAVLALAIVIAVPADAGHKKSGNQGQLYRLPWLEATTSYLSGYGPNGSADHGAGTIDFQFDDGEPVKSIADGTVVTRRDDYCSGWKAEISHVISGQTTRVSRYYHLKAAPPVQVNDRVTQGQVIGYADNSGSEDNYTYPSYQLCSSGTHLHFDLREGATSISWGAAGIADVTAISQRAADDFATSSNVEVSNNAGAGMWGPGGAYEDVEVKNLYFVLGGWPNLGSASRMETTWEVCNGSGVNRIGHVCPSQFGNLRAQTFRWITEGRWRSALVGPHGRGGGVSWVPHPFYAAYTNQYDSSKVWSYWVGMPTSGLYYPVPSDSDLIALNFEGGYYMWWRKSQCLVAIYRSGVQRAAWSGTTYCGDTGGGPAYPGYGSDGN